MSFLSSVRFFCQSLRELNAVIRKKQCKPRHTQPCLMEGVFLLTAGDLDGSRVAGKFRAAWKERDEIEATLRAASESEMLAMMVYWLEGSTAVAKQARNLVKERELVAWIEEQNEERGYAPIYKEVYSKKWLLITTVTMAVQIQTISANSRKRGYDDFENGGTCTTVFCEKKTTPVRHKSRNR